MILGIEVSLGAHANNKALHEADFIQQLQTDGREIVKNNNRGSSHRLVIFRQNFGEFQGLQDGSLHFSRKMQQNWSNAATWLQSQSASTFRDFMENDLTVRAFVDLWIDDDQLDLILPPES